MKGFRFSDFCANCRHPLANVERILFVEREIGRCFCSEDCIRDYFQPTVDLFMEELDRQRNAGDLSNEDAAKFSHYRQLTLEDPDEVWVNQTESGDRYFAFIAHFRQGEEQLSHVVVCLAIDAHPSFVFLNFASRDEGLIDEYRKGIEVRSGAENLVTQEEVEAVPDALPETQGLESLETEEGPAAAETHSLSIMQQLYEENRQEGDIARDAFSRFNDFVDPTMDDADEIWRFKDEGGTEWCTFIAKYRAEAEDFIEEDEEGMEEPSDGPNEFALIVVAEVKKDGLHVAFFFPTVDPALVQRFRKGINSLNKAFGVGWAWGRAA